MLETLESRQMLAFTEGSLFFGDQLVGSIIPTTTLPGTSIPLTSIDWSGRSEGREIGVSDLGVGPQSESDVSALPAFDPGEFWTFRAESSGALQQVRFQYLDSANSAAAKITVGTNPPILIIGSDLEYSLWTPESPIAVHQGDSVRIESVGFDDVGSVPWMIRGMSIVIQASEPTVTPTLSRELAVVGGQDAQAFDVVSAAAVDSGSRAIVSVPDPLAPHEDSKPYTVQLAWHLPNGDVGGVQTLDVYPIRPEVVEDFRQQRQSMASDAVESPSESQLAQLVNDLVTGAFTSRIELLSDDTASLAAAIKDVAQVVKGIVTTPALSANNAITARIYNVVERLLLKIESARVTDAEIGDQLQKDIGHIKSLVEILISDDLASGREIDAAIGHIAISSLGTHGDLLSSVWAGIGHNMSFAPEVINERGDIRYVGFFESGAMRLSDDVIVTFVQPAIVQMTIASNSPPPPLSPGAPGNCLGTSCIVESRSAIDDGYTSSGADATYLRFNIDKLTSPSASFKATLTLTRSSGDPTQQTAEFTQDVLLNNHDVVATWTEDANTVTVPVPTSTFVTTKIIGHPVATSDPNKFELDVTDALKQSLVRGDVNSDGGLVFTTDSHDDVARYRDSLRNWNNLSLETQDDLYWRITGRQRNGQALTIENQKELLAMHSKIEGDIVVDSSIDAGDAGKMFEKWGNGTTNDYFCGDINGDNNVDAGDAGIMFDNWGSSPTRGKLDGARPRNLSIRLSTPGSNVVRYVDFDQDNTNAPTLTVTYHPDIAITSFAGATSGTGTYSGKLRLQYTIDTGFPGVSLGSPSIAPFQLQLYRSPRSDSLVGATPLGPTISISEHTLLTNGAHTYDFTPDLFDSATNNAEDYYLMAVVDIGNSIDEMREENNFLSFSGGVFQETDKTIHVHGLDGNDSVTVNGTVVSFSLAGATAITFTPVDSLNPVPNVQIRSHGGTDTISLTAWTSSTVTTPEPITGARLPRSFVAAGDGNDLITGSGGYDVLAGGRGDDVYKFQSVLTQQYLGVDQIVELANQGIDTIDLSLISLGSGATGAILDLSATVDQIVLNRSPTSPQSPEFKMRPLADQEVENLTGTVRSDVLAGNALANAIRGGSGNDQVFGRAGADQLFGGDGDDKLRGGGGLNDGDKINGENGWDDPEIVDNLDSSFSATSTFAPSAALFGGFNRDSRSASGGTTPANEYAQWSFSGLNGYYDIWATWPTTDSTYAIDAVFQVSVNGGAYATVGTFNQQSAPNGLGVVVSADRPWKLLASQASFAGAALAGTIDVRLLRHSNKFVIADAVRLVQTPLVDNQGAAAFSSTAAFSSNSTAAGAAFSDGVHIASAGGTGTDYAAWNFSSLTGAYRVWATWPTGDSTYATNAQFKYARDGGSTFTTFSTVNQSIAPPGANTIANRPWKELGIVTGITSSLQIRLDRNSTKKVSADAIRLEKLNASGVKYSDANQTASRDAGESLLEDWFIYNDANSSGTWDNSESFRLTDENGIYAFEGNGTYKIREQQQCGWKQTAPSGNLYDVNMTTSPDTASGKDFGNFQHSVSVGESSNLVSEIWRIVTLPATRNMLRIGFCTIGFDGADADPANPRDTLQFAVLDPNTNKPIRPVVQGSPAFSVIPGTDAVFSVTETLAPVLGSGAVSLLDADLNPVTSFSPRIASGYIQVDVSSLPAGTQLKLVGRLLNDDTDVLSKASVMFFEWDTANQGNYPSMGNSSVSVLPAPIQSSSISPQVDFSNLHDVTRAFDVKHEHTLLNPIDTAHQEYNVGDLFESRVRITRNSSALQPRGALILAITGPVPAGNQLVEFDGRLPWDIDGVPAGTPFIRINDAVENRNGFFVTDNGASRQVALKFRPTSRAQLFDYGLVVLGELNRAPKFTSDPFDAPADDAAPGFAKTAAQIQQLLFTVTGGTPADRLIDLAHNDVKPWLEGEFLVNGIVLSDSAKLTTLVASLQWHLSSGSKEYVIKVESGTFKVYSPMTRPILQIVTQSGSQFQYTVSGVDPDHDHVTFSQIAGPGSLNGKALTWNVASVPAGSYVFTLRATDEYGLYDERQDQSFSLQVIDPPSNRPPEILSSPNITADPLQSYTYDVNAVDPDAQPLTYEVVTGAKPQRFFRSLAASAGQSIKSLVFTTPLASATAPTGISNVRLYEQNAKNDGDSIHFSAERLSTGSPAMVHNSSVLEAFGTSPFTYSLPIGYPITAQTILEITVDNNVTVSLKNGSGTQLGASIDLKPGTVTALPSASMVGSAVHWTAPTDIRGEWVRMDVTVKDSGSPQLSDSQRYYVYIVPSKDVPSNGTVDLTVSNVNLSDWYLFDAGLADSSNVAALNSGSTPTSLSNAFVSRGIMLPNTYSIEKITDSLIWRISGTNPSYVIRAESGKLKVYSAMVYDQQRLSVRGIVRADITNLGPADVLGPFSVTFFENTDFVPGFDAASDRILGVTRVDTSLSGSNSDASHTITVSAQISGQVSFAGAPIWAFVDSGSMIPESSESNNTASSSDQCFVVPDVLADPVVQWSIQGVAGDSNFWSTPQVGDLNGDGVPEIVTITSANDDYLAVPEIKTGRLRAFSGATGADIWAAGNLDVNNLPDNYVFPRSTPAIADLDGDGLAEVIGVGPHKVLIFRGTGTLLGTLPWPNGVPQGLPFWAYAPTVANIVPPASGFDYPEIVLPGFYAKISSIGPGTITFDSVVTFDEPFGEESDAAPAVVDLNGDGVPEVFTNVPHDVDGAIGLTGPHVSGNMWRQDTPYHAKLAELVADPSLYPVRTQAAVVEADADSKPELAVTVSGPNTRETWLYLLDDDGDVLGSYYRIRPSFWDGSSAGGAPTIADLDGDGTPEIVVAYFDEVVGFKIAPDVETDITVEVTHEGLTGPDRRVSSHLTRAWVGTIDDLSSGQGGSSAFDFDGDGKMEIVYRDEHFLHVLGAAPGGQLLDKYPGFKPSLLSTTWQEMPVVADVDGDGNAEIIATEDGSVLGKLVVYEDGYDTWLPSRAAWNQYTYHITNVDDNGSIPSTELPSWDVNGPAANSYRANRWTASNSPLHAPELIPSYVRVNQIGNTAEVTVRVGNAGSVFVDKNVDVHFYKEAPNYDNSGTAATGSIGTAKTALRLKPGEHEDVTVTVNTSSYPGGVLDTNNLWVVVDPHWKPAFPYRKYGDVRECSTVAINGERNNIYHPVLGYVPIPEIEKIKIASTPSKTTTVGQEYSYDVNVANLAGQPVDAVFELTSKPSDMSIDRNGVIHWTPKSTGNQTIAIRAIDPSGAIATQSYVLRVVPENDPPQILEIPDIYVTSGATLNHPVERYAIDESVSTLRLAVGLIGKPPGLSIDFATRSLKWDTASVASGDYTARLIVTDEFGLSAARSFDIHVVDGNPRPVVVAYPGNLKVGEAGTIPLCVTDDNLPVSLALDGVSKAMGMKVVSYGGTVANCPASNRFGLTWTPPREGSFFPELTATDALGASASYTITLKPSLVNQAPSLLEKPPKSIGRGRNFKFEIRTYDPERDPINVVVPLNKLATGLSYDSATRIISGVPTTLDDSFTFDLQLSDTEHTVVETYEVAIVDNLPPAIIEWPKKVRAVVGQATTLTFKVVDMLALNASNSIRMHLPTDLPGDATWLDPGEAIASPSSNPQSPSSFQVSLTPTKIGRFPISVRVDDADGKSDTKVVDLEVFASTIPLEWSYSARNVAAIGQLFEGQAIANDSSATFSFEGVSPPGMSIDPISGRVTWIPTAAAGSNPIDYQIKTSGYGSSSTRTFQVRVVDRFTNAIPVIDSSPVGRPTLDRPMTYQAHATDDDGDVLRWKLESNPDGGASLTEQGYLVWRITEDELDKELVADISVTDGHVTVSQRVRVLTSGAGVNTPPRIVTLPPPAVAVGQMYRYRVEASDDEGGALNLFADNPVAAVTPLARNVWNVEFTMIAGTNVVPLRVVDDRGLVGSQTISVSPSIVLSDTPPQLLGSPPRSAAVGTAYVYTVQADDPDGTPTYSASAVNAQGQSVAIAINPTSGVISWTPVLADVGTVRVTLKATQSGANDSYSYDVKVISPLAGNLPPVLQAATGLKVTNGGLFTYDVKATDAEGGTLEFYLVNPLGNRVREYDGFTITPDGRITWAAAYVGALPGTKTFVATARDSQHAYANSLAYNVAVQADQPPTVALSANRSKVATGGRVEFTAIVTDDVGTPDAGIYICAPWTGGCNPNITSTFKLINTNTFGVGVLTAPSSYVGQTIKAVAKSSYKIGNTVAYSESPTVSVQIVAPDSSPATIEVANLTPGTVLTSKVNLDGIIYDSQLSSYSVAVRTEAGTLLPPLKTGTTSVGAPGAVASLGVTIDPFTLPQGNYDLVVTAVDTSQITDSLVVPFSVDTALKLENFSISFTDLEMSVGGFPLSIVRTYDSQQADVDGDFGFGWNMSMSQARLDLASAFNTDDQQWEKVYLPPLRAGGRIAVTLPNGERHGFTIMPEIIDNDSTSLGLGGVAAQFGEYAVAFQPDAMQGSRLDLANGEQFYFRDDVFFNRLSPKLIKQGYISSTAFYVNGDFRQDPIAQGRPFNPADKQNSESYSQYYRLTTADGTEYFFDSATGKFAFAKNIAGSVFSLTESGATVTDENSVELANITIARSNNRIDRITDPSGNSIAYTYDTTGNLVSVVDREATRIKSTVPTVRYEYGQDRNSDPTWTFTDPITNGPQIEVPGHHLTSIINALNTPVLRVGYKADGHIRRIGDAGNKTATSTFSEFASGNVTYRRERVEDALANPTDILRDTRGNVVRRAQRVSKGANPSLTVTTDDVYLVTLFEYDEQGLPTKAYQPFQVVTATNDLQLTALPAIGHPFSESHYDARGRMESTRDGLGRITSFTYTDNTMTVHAPAIGSEDPHETVYDYVTGTTLIGSAVDAAGRETQFQYGALGALERVLRFGDSGPIESDISEYDSAGRPIQVTSGTGEIRYMAYDATGRLTHSWHVWTDPKNPGNRKTIATASIFDAEGRNTETRQYEMSGAFETLASLLDAIGQNIMIPSSNVQYDAAGRVWVTTDRFGNKTYQQYDIRGNVVETRTSNVTVANQYRIVRTVYDDNGRVIITTDPFIRTNPKNPTEVGFSPDSDALLPGAAALDMLVSITQYDDAGRTIASERRSEATVTLSLMGGIYSSTGGATGTLLSTQKTTYIAASGTDGGMTETEVTYPSQTNRIKTQSYLDKAGRQSKQSVLEMSGNTVVKTITTQYGYDEEGRQIWVSDPIYPNDTTRAHGTHYQYDPAGLLLRTISKGNVATNLPDVIVETEYDNAGRKKTQWDGARQATQFHYDDVGRLESVEMPGAPDASTSSTKDVVAKYVYNYDTFGNRKEIIDPRGKTTTFSFDQSGRQLTRQLPTATAFVETNEYYTGGLWHGLLKKSTDFEGRRIEYTYDNAGRKLREMYFDVGHISRDREITYTYDAFDRVKTVNDTVDGLTTNYYDGEGRLIKEESLRGTVNHVFDSETGLLKSTYTGSTPTERTRTQYQYDTYGRLSQVTAEYRAGEAINEVTTYKYDDAGRLDYEVAPSGVTKNTEYDALGRIVRIEHFRDSATGVVGDWDGTEQLVASYDYLYDAAGRKREATENMDKDGNGTLDPQKFTWSYDNVGRLIQEAFDENVNGWNSGNDYVDRYGFDKAGNRVLKTRNIDSDATLEQTTTYQYDNNDRLTTETLTDTNSSPPQTTTTYEYSGPTPTGTKQTKKSVSTGSTVITTTMAYNELGRLKQSVVTTTGQPSVTTDFGYDSQGRRVSQSVNGQKTLYLWDCQNPTGYDQVLEQGINDNADSALATTEIDAVYTLGHDVITHAAISPRRVMHLMYDAHGSTRALLNTFNGSSVTVVADNSVRQVYTYEAYGNLLGFGATTPSTNLLYSGEWTDSTGLQYLRARYYDPKVGRFNSLDAYAGNASDPQSLHKYAYVHGDPVQGVDPSGMVEFSVAGFNVSFSISSYMSATVANYAVGKGISAGIDYFANGKLDSFQWFTWWDLTAFIPGALWAASFRRIGQVGNIAGAITREAAEQAFARLGPTVRNWAPGILQAPNQCVAYCLANIAKNLFPKVDAYSILGGIDEELVSLISANGGRGIAWGQIGTVANKFGLEAVRTPVKNSLEEIGQAIGNGNELMALLGPRDAGHAVRVIGVLDDGWLSLYDPAIGFYEMVAREFFKRNVTQTYYRVF